MTKARLRSQQADPNKL